MKKVELLSPVGNREMLYQAIHNGCDAVYLGGEDFGARKYSSNFNKEEIKEALRYSHLYNVKVYVTVNTIIYEKEVERFIDYVTYLYSIGVDALIMQDIGMIMLVKEKFPDFEIHASTQMHNHNEEGIKLLKELGVSRVVLDRELSLKEINAISVEVEKEVFIHGALCISYSGNCLMSSLIGGRSGNRGMCAGSCRLPYTLMENDKEVETEGKYLLSTKEFSSIPYLKSILDSNIDSLKIEGRMKSPEYVGLVTKIYRKLIDKYDNHEALTITEEEIHDLKKIFNRGFTKGFLHGASNQELMNIKSPNHIGVELGEVVEFNKKKIKIKLKEELNQNDGIRFVDQEKGCIVNYLYDEKDNLISSAKEYVYLDNTFSIRSKTKVLKTFDSKLKEQLSHVREKKIPIAFTLEAKIGKPLKLKITDFENTFSIDKEEVEQAKKKATTKEEIKEKLLRIKDTVFEAKEIHMIMDENIFIPMSLLNQMRRSLVQQLIESRYHDKREIPTKKIITEGRNKPLTNEISIVVRNEEQLKTCIEEKVDCIYVDDYALYVKYKQIPNVYYNLDRVNRGYVNYDKDHILISDLGALKKYKENSATSCYLNVVNSYSVNYLLQYAYKVTCSVENNFEQIEEMITSYKAQFKENPNLDVIVYGKVDLMITKYCPLNLLVNKDKICRICKNQNKYYLKDRKNAFYPILPKKEITHILHSKNIDYLDNISKLKQMGIFNYTIILFDEEKHEIKNILKKVI